MNGRRQKLELNWIGKDEELKLEPRILIEDSKKSYGDQGTENLLIHGDNLLTLKALEQNFTGKIKCIYIDPPYNTGSAFEHYDDNLEHSTWLNLIRPRLELFKNLLDNEQGSIWISIDDDESHYLKVLCDEVFGRKNFVNTIVWHKKHTRSNDARWLSDNHDFILVYARNKDLWKRNLLPRPDETTGYENIDNDPRGPWASGPCHAKTPNPKDIYPIKTPSGRELLPPPGTSWRFSVKRFKELIAENRIYFGKDGNNVPRYKRFLTEVQDGLVPTTIWFKDEVGDNQQAKQEVKSFNAKDVFTTPKPERLIERILQIATSEGDWVLDSFLGSGTLAAVAHKMKRKWIGIELGEHCYTHCLPRLKKVVDGKDKLPLSEILGWKGGGGFRFYELAPSLLRKDKFGNWIIEEKYNANMLAAAMCKHEGFKFFPDPEVYWKQGKSTETDYIFVTTSFVTIEQLDKIHEEMKQSESLLISAKAFAPGCKERHGNITIKKIPQMILGKCEFGKNNYDLNIINALRKADEDTEEDE